MNSVYSFSFSRYLEDQKHTRKISASGYKNAIEKACIILEELDSEVDLIGLTNWEDVQDECAEHGLYIDDLIELDE